MVELTRHDLAFARRQRTDDSKVCGQLGNVLKLGSAPNSV